MYNYQCSKYNVVVLAEETWVTHTEDAILVGRVYTTRSCEGWAQHLRPSILVVRTEGHKIDRSIWV
uniref:Uncharacterized protein n=1 Tax=Helianthus annuus TaxID=4232 RepID=A0A251UUH3_HELAN